jgi:hypothetical protein
MAYSETLAAGGMICRAAIFLSRWGGFGPRKDSKDRTLCKITRSISHGPLSGMGLRPIFS